MAQDKDERIKKEALEYHEGDRPGKIEVVATKPFISAHDLSMAYTPGVAEPCRKIHEDEKNVFKYTSKGNLVAVISNGSAVLGLGNIGPLASKPVMEGKGILFKRFADIDVFDIEIDASTVDKMEEIISGIAPTFGGINLEDIKAPECFELEKRLIEKLDIPVFHDDQHGTAIITSAAFVNAIEVSKRDISTTTIVVSGAGAAAMACSKLLFDLGVKRENLLMCDSKGVIYTGRSEGMNKYKEEFAQETNHRTLADAINGADAFIGCSARGVLTQEMVKTMGPQPIIFAMANPEPEIYPEEVHEVRDDAIMATGRSDFPNQVNNVLGFPFIFRGALDVKAKKINKEMKLAAVYALADLAKREVPEEVSMAYGNKNFTFGREYLIPKPFDTRILTALAPAVAKAAMDSGVAQGTISDFHQYATSLEDRLSSSASFMKSMRDRFNTLVKKYDKKVRVVFSEGRNTRILNAVAALKAENKIEPILLGNKAEIHSQMDELGLESLKELEIITPEKHSQFKDFYTDYMTQNQRNGVGWGLAKELMGQENYFGSMMINHGLADILISGPTLHYSECLKPGIRIIGTHNNQKASGIFILVYKDRVLFLADCTTQINPTSEDLSCIAKSAADLYKQMLGKNPQIAFLSYSNFGTSTTPEAKKMKEAVRITKEKHPDLICDGEVQADVAVNKYIMNNLFSFSDIDQSADILIFPDLNSANISYKLLGQLSQVTALGPILVPMEKSFNIIQRTASVKEIVDISTLTAHMHLAKQEEV
jgi:malate dehydrogenase (oxaloacetate-decarboxylating)(NADP+)